MELLERSDLLNRPPNAEHEPDFENGGHSIRKKQSKCIFFLRTQYQICLICFMFLIFLLQSIQDWVTSVVSAKDQSKIITAFATNFVNMTEQINKCNKTL
jgi:hypothetical protein